MEATTNQACAAIDLNDSLTFVRPYLKLVLTASYEANRRLSSGGVQPNLSVGIVKKLRISLPPKREQERIVDETALQLALIDRLESELDTQVQRVAALHSSILSAAFLGTLVAQDPEDQPSCHAP